MPWSVGGVSDFGFVEQGFDDVGLVLSAAQVSVGCGGEFVAVGWVCLHGMAFEVAVEEFYGVEFGAVAG